MRSKGAVIDVSTLDCISTQWRNDAANLDALIDGGCVDTISTDFAGGHWDGILEAIHRMVRKEQLSAPAAVALATGNVAAVFPQMAGDRGLIEKGKRADLTVVDHVNLSRVRHVVIDGRVAVRNGVPV
ncbi:amidohydrolase family protein [Rhizobium mongolense]